VATGVSGRTVQTAKALKQQAPDLAEQVDAGTMSLHKAQREAARRRGPVVRLLDDQRSDDSAAGDGAQPDIAEGEHQGNVVPMTGQPPSAVVPIEHWSAEEQEKRSLLESGIAVAVNLRSHRSLIAWAQARDPFMRVDRTTRWGNPFELGKDGDRETVIANYRDHYLPFKPSLTARLDALRGKALGCWCAPERCHADVLIRELGGDAR
jgi:hypothetical protein